jgi:hypothetical protein
MAEEVVEMHLTVDIVASVSRSYFVGKNFRGCHSYPCVPIPLAHSLRGSVKRLMIQLMKKVVK